MSIQIIETPNGKNVCDSCSYKLPNPTRASYQINFKSGDRLNICFTCFDKLYELLKSKANRGNEQ